LRCARRLQFRIAERSRLLERRRRLVKPTQLIERAPTIEEHLGIGHGRRRSVLARFEHRLVGLERCGVVTCVVQIVGRPQRIDIRRPRRRRADHEQQHCADMSSRTNHQTVLRFRSLRHISITSITSAAARNN
jgi:hypothetical protein